VKERNTDELTEPARGNRPWTGGLWDGWSEPASRKKLLRRSRSTSEAHLETHINTTDWEENQWGKKLQTGEAPARN